MHNEVESYNKLRVYAKRILIHGIYNKLLLLAIIMELINK
jgi:hypothetical protein